MVATHTNVLQGWRPPRAGPDPGDQWLSPGVWDQPAAGPHPATTARRGGGAGGRPGPPAQFFIIATCCPHHQHSECEIPEEAEYCSIFKNQNQGVMLI